MCKNRDKIAFIYRFLTNLGMARAFLGIAFTKK